MGVGVFMCTHAPTQLMYCTLTSCSYPLSLPPSLLTVSPQIGSGMLITTNVTEGQVGFTKSTTSYDDVIIGDKVT